MKRVSQKNNSAELPQIDVDVIQRKVAQDIKRPIRTLSDLERHLALWWCRHYNRPYKCAELAEYTFEELLYEYFDVHYRSNPEALNKYLSGELEAEGAEQEEDEEWLKDMMGKNYMSKKEQEKVLAPAKKVILGKDDNEDADDISYVFEEFI